MTSQVVGLGAAVQYLNEIGMDASPRTNTN